MLIFLLILLFIALYFLVYASYSIESGIYVNAYCRAKTSRKVVSITFDDGPFGKRTEKILDLLLERNVKAAFFCIGERAVREKDIVKRMHEDGHLVGNHGFSHSSMFPFFNFEKMKEDIDRCNKVIESVTGEKVGFFRPPFGVTNPILRKVLKTFSFDVIGWNVRSLDTSIDDVDKIVGRVIKRIEPGCVILLHDRVENSDEILAKILQWLDKNEYEVERVDQMLGLPLSYDN